MRIVLLINILSFSQSLSKDFIESHAKAEFKDPEAKKDFEKGISEFNNGNFTEAQSWFNLSISKEPTEIAFLLRTRSTYATKDCSTCKSYRDKLDNGNYSVLRSYFSACFMVDSLIYTSLSNADTIFYSKMWISLCGAGDIDSYFFQKYPKQGIIQSFSVKKGDDPLEKRPSNYIRNYPDISKLVADSIMIRMPNLQPSFPGGEVARMNFLWNNIHYPEEAKELNLMGKVFASFIINEDGTVSDIKIVRGIGRSCDQEYLRILNLMPRWNPGVANGKLCKVQFILPIKFTLQ